MGVAYELKIDNPNLPVGELVMIHGLGSFANGETHEISTELADSFRTYWSHGDKLGPTLLTWAKASKVVEVSVPREQKPKANNNNDNGGGAS